MKNVSRGYQYTKFRTSAYNEKLYPKAAMILEALQVGVSVLAIDIDTVFLKDPLPFVKFYNHCDIAIIKQEK